MQPTSDTYDALLVAGARKEVRCIIGDTAYSAASRVTYTYTKIVSGTITASLMDRAASIGNASVKQLNLVLRDYSEIPRTAQIRVQFRLKKGNTASEWLPKGTFFVDTRDEGNGIISITAFDPMLKADRSYTTNGNQSGWPKTDLAVVQAICSRIGVTLDPRTTEVMTNRYQIQYPGYGDGAYTMRELLQFIAAAYAGNFYITDENKLLLVGLGDFPAQTNYLVTELNDCILIGGYRILV